MNALERAAMRWSKAFRFDGVKWRAESRAVLERAAELAAASEARQRALTAMAEDAYRAQLELDARHRRVYERPRLGRDPLGAS